MKVTDIISIGVSRCSKCRGKGPYSINRRHDVYGKLSDVIEVTK